MKNVIILGASGNIAKHVIDILVKNDDINLTLFLRDARRLRNRDVSRGRIVEGDVLNNLFARLNIDLRFFNQELEEIDDTKKNPLQSYQAIYLEC